MWTYYKNHVVGPDQKGGWIVNTDKTCQAIVR